MLRVFLTNLGKYNEGELVGEWLDLPATEEELQAAFRRIGINGVDYEEYFFTDWETDIEGLRLGEYMNLEELNELAAKYEDLQDWEKETVQAIMELEGCDLEEAVEVRDQYSLYPDIHTNEDLGYYWFFEAGICDIPDNLACYIDCERFGRDVALEADGGFTSKGWLERI
jgi:hypothetical protein